MERLTVESHGIVSKREKEKNIVNGVAEGCPPLPLSHTSEYLNLAGVWLARDT